MKQSLLMTTSTIRDYLVIINDEFLAFKFKMMTAMASNDEIHKWTTNESYSEYSIIHN